MPVTYRDDPYPAFNFEVLVNGISDDGRSVKGSFMEVSGLGVEIPVIEYRTGSEEITVRKIPGLKKFPNIVLKRGIIGDLTFWNWLLEAMNGRVRRAGGSIILLDEGGNAVLRWSFKRGWPCKWSGPALNAKGNEIAIETLEICHEGLDVDSQG
jgi:phage tail-like protein